MSMWIFLRIGGVGLEVAGDAVVEAHAKGQQQVGFLDGVVGPRFAVHAHHAQGERVAGGEAAQAEQGHRHGGLGLFGKVAQLGHGVAHQHAAPGQDHRAFGVLDQLDGALQISGQRAQVGAVAGQADGRVVVCPIRSRPAGHLWRYRSAPGRAARCGRCRRLRARCGRYRAHR